MYDYIRFGGCRPPEEIINKVCGENENFFNDCNRGPTGPTGPTGPRGHREA